MFSYGSNAWKLAICFRHLQLWEGSVGHGNSGRRAWAITIWIRVMIHVFSVCMNLLLRLRESMLWLLRSWNLGQDTEGCDNDCSCSNTPWAESSYLRSTQKICGLKRLWESLEWTISVFAHSLDIVRSKEGQRSSHDPFRQEICQLSYYNARMQWLMRSNTAYIYVFKLDTCRILANQWVVRGQAYLGCNFLFQLGSRWDDLIPRATTVASSAQRRSWSLVKIPEPPSKCLHSSQLWDNQNAQRIGLCLSARDPGKTECWQSHLMLIDRIDDEVMIQLDNFWLHFSTPNVFFTTFSISNLFGIRQGVGTGGFAGFAWCVET